MNDASLNRLDLTPAFIRQNQEDPAWLRALPALLARAAAAWSLTIDPPFPGIAINYVAPARRVDGIRCVLKVSRHLEDTRSEIAALRHWDGQGAVRLLESDPDNGILLLEQLEPGTTLVEVAEADDEAATLIATTILRQLWRPVSEPGDLQSLHDWCAAYDRNRQEFSRGAGGFPARLFQRADALRQELLASTATPTLLHGDLHHFNILRAQRASWLAIDPKGLVGDPCFDVCQFLRNPRPVPARVNRRRLDVFCAELDLDRERTRAWCVVHAVLDAVWSFEEGRSWQRAVTTAEECRSL